VPVSVRTCKTVAEYRDALGAIGEYGTWDPSEEDRERFRRYLPYGRMHAAFEGRKVVGGAGAFDYEVSVPGGSVSCAGVTVVGVYPPHIRRGILTAMMRAQLDDAHERGDEIAMLWASDERIYGRYGYGVASHVGEVEIQRDRGGFADPVEPRSTISYVELGKGRAVADPIWRHIAGERPGFFQRSKDWWEARVLLDPPERRAGAGAKRLVTVELDGGVEGYALYRHAPNFAEGLTAGRIVAIEVLARSLEAERTLWRYLTSIEWASAVKARLLPLDSRLFWILAQPAQMKMRVGDGVWVRLLDVGKALSARSYSASGPITFQVADDFCSWNAGRWKLEDGVAKKTRADADLACDVTALGSVYLGGFTFAQLVRGGRVEELKKGAAARADSMFRTDLLPWCPEVF
jgi:predicted acetyltransferase